MSTATATVEVLTAEVRVLMVGSRQVTLSVYRQLDWADSNEIDPMGRVRDSRQKDDDGIEVVGRAGDGTLVRACRRMPNPIRVDVTGLVNSGEFRYQKWALVNWDGREVRVEWSTYPQYARDRDGWEWRSGDASLRAKAMIDKVASEYDWQKSGFEEWQALPLIVLAGLR